LPEPVRDGREDRDPEEQAFISVAEKQVDHRSVSVAENIEGSQAL
jgi:hypothetical protein